MRILIGLAIGLAVTANPIAGQTLPNAAPSAGFQNSPSSKTVSDGDLRVRRQWISASIGEGKQGRAKVVSRLAAPIAGDRAAAIFVLASTGASETLPLIAHMLVNDEAEFVRIQAAEALGAFGSPDGVSVLVRAAESDEIRDVRVRAITSLGRINSRTAVSLIRKTLLSAASEQEFQAAAIASGQLRILATESELVAASEDQQRSVHSRSAAILALGLMASPHALTTVLPLTRDPSPVVRFNAISAIDELQNETTAAELKRVFTNSAEEHYIRIRAASALVRLDTQDSIAALREVAEGEDEFMAMHTIVAMVQRHPAQARILALALRARARDGFVVQIVDNVIAGRAVPWGSR